MRHLIEEDLMEKYHWTPEQINRLSYKWLQKHYIIDKVKREALETRNQLQNFKAQNAPRTTSSGRGQSKRTVISGFDNVVASNKSPAKRK